MSPERWLGAVAALGLMGCSSSVGTDARCPPSPFASATSLVIAHAGGEALGPSNTVEAMRRSLAAGADVLDADVRMTKDGALVAIHDPTVDAVSDGTGPIAGMTLAEVRQLDFGYEFTAADGSHPDRGTGVRISTVEDILIAFPDTLTSLELKVAGAAPDKLCDLLRRTKRMDNVYVSSNGDAGVDRFKQVCPEGITTVTDALVPVLQAESAKGAASTWCSPVPIGQPPFRGARPNAESIAWSHAHGLATYTWTIDDEQTMRALAEIHVDGFYTRRPDLARKVVDSVTADG